MLIAKRGKELILKKEEDISSIFGDQTLLAEDWLSKEDEEAFAYLQQK
jgi:hypothetical protein